MEGPDDRKNRKNFMLTRRQFSKSFLAGGTALLGAGDMWPANDPLSSPDKIPNQKFDLLIKGGTVIDTAQRLHGTLDVAVKAGKILSVAPDIPEHQSAQVFSAKDAIVTPGFIDLHVHCFDGIGAGMNADHYCLGRGVPTVVDAGSAGYTMIDGFLKYVVKTSLTRIFALVDIGALGTVIGIREHPMENLEWVNPELTARAAEENKPTVVGIKVRLQKSIEGANDIECLNRALQAAEICGLPLMAHIDNPESPLPDIVKMLRKGDVFTHFFNNHEHSILDANQKILPEVLEARDRGVFFDIAEGSSHMSFDVAEKCLMQDFLPDTISTDLYNGNVFGPTYDLPTLASKFLALGMNLDKVVELVTIKPAQVFDYGMQLGTLKPGTEADISIFEVREGKFEYMDADKKKLTGHQQLVSKAVVRGGQLFLNQD
jgi:dihydroorotase